MPKLPVLTGKEVMKILENLEFNVVRQKGSYMQMQHEDGRLITIPVHSGKTVAR